MSGPPTLDTPVIIIGKTMLMHERVHRRAADLPEDFRKAVQKGGVSTSSVKILENRRSFKVLSQASVLTDTMYKPAVLETETNIRRVESDR